MARSRSESTESHWRQLIEEWSRSGQTQPAFCRQRDVSLWSFRSWRGRLLKRDGQRTRRSPRRFTPVEVIPSANGSTVEITLTNGRTLRVPSALDPQQVGRLISVAESC
jgi:hypothetical protein